MDIVRLQLQRPAPAGDRFVQLPLVLQRNAQVVVRLGKVRIQLQCPPVAGDRFGNPAQGTIGAPQVDMEGSRTAVQADRPANVLDGNLVLARLGSDHAEKMNRIGLTRFNLQNPPVDLLGGLQPAGLMVLDRDRQCFGNRCHNVNKDNMPAGQGASAVYDHLLLYPDANEAESLPRL
jgi:hypothetical protein